MKNQAKNACKDAFFRYSHMRFGRGGLGVRKGLGSKGFEDGLDLFDVGHVLPGGEVCRGVTFLQEFA